MTIDFNFKCPRCAKSRLEEVVTNVTQFTAVTSLENDGGDSVSCNYGDCEFNTDNCDGIARFQCRDCQFTLEDYRGTIDSEERLMVWLGDWGMLVTVVEPVCKHCGGSIRVRCVVNDRTVWEHCDDEWLGQTYQHSCELKETE